MKQPQRSLRPDAIDSVIPTQEHFQRDLQDGVRSAVHATPSGVLEAELERLVGAGRTTAATSVFTYGTATTLYAS